MTKTEKECLKKNEDDKFLLANAIRNLDEYYLRPILHSYLVTKTNSDLSARIIDTFTNIKDAHKDYNLNH
jgi:wobble nucleotide-excising tRNase